MTPTMSPSSPRRKRRESETSPYPGSRLANLKVNENADRRKDVQGALSKNRATRPGEELAVAVYNKLPEAAKNKKYRVEVVYKLIDQLYNNPELRQGVRSLEEFRDRVKKFLREKRGQEWVNLWLQPDTTANGGHINNPPVPVGTTRYNQRAPIVFVPDQPAPIASVPDRLNRVTLSPLNTRFLDRGLTLVDPNVMRSSAMNRTQGSATLISHRRRASDSLLYPCPWCLRHHGETTMPFPPITSGGTEYMRVPRYERGRGHGPVMNELMIVLRCMLIFSFAVLLSSYSENNFR